MVVDLPPLFEPPAIYDHEPTKPYLVVVLSEDGVLRRCHGIRVACAIPRWRLIVIDETLEGERRDTVLRHEKAHLNGWVHDGPICIAPFVSNCIEDRRKFE